MATHSIFGNNPVEVPGHSLVVTQDPGTYYRIGTQFYTSGAGTETDGWRCKGARIYVGADSGPDTLPDIITLSLWVQPVIDATTLGTPPLRTGTVNTAGRPGWFEVSWESVEVFGGQKFLIGYEANGNYQYVPTSNSSPYDDSVQAADGSSLFMSEHGGPEIRGYFYDVNTNFGNDFGYYSGLDVLIDDDSEAPTQPSTLDAVVDGQKVALSWGASTDNVAVLGYRIYRDTTPGFTTSAVNRIATTSAVTAFTDILFTSHTYYYKLSAMDGAGNESALSNEVTAVVTVDGTGVYLFPSDIGWSVGSTTTDPIIGGQTLGTAFMLSKASPIAGIRFYAPSPMTNNTFRLWANGSMVAAKTNVSVTAGWNVCLFDTQIDGLTGVSYVVSVFMGDTSQTYTALASQFSTIRTTVGTVYSEVYENGVYGNGDAFPQESQQSPWYGIDVVVIAPPARTGNVNVWDGAAWQSHPIKRWDGSNWQQHPANGYDGTDFIIGK